MRGNVLSVAMRYFLLKRIKNDRDRLAAYDAVPTIRPDGVESRLDCFTKPYLTKLSAPVTWFQNWELTKMKLGNRGVI